MDHEVKKRQLIARFAEFGPCGNPESEESSGDCAGKKKKSTDASSVTPDTNTTEKPQIKRKKRPPPAVIVFEEPGKKQKIEDFERKGNSSKKPRDRLEEVEDDDFSSIAEEVKEFGMTGFSRKERKKYEQKKAQMLGARAPKGQKMPYKIVMYATKVRKQRELEDQEQKREMGITVKKKPEAKPDRKGPLGWWSDRSKGVNPSVGKFKGGKYHIGKLNFKKKQ